MEIRDSFGGHAPEPNRRLRVIERGRSRDATDRNLPVCRVDIELESYPRFLVSFAVRLGAHIAFARQIVEHLLQRHLSLALQPRRFRRLCLALPGAFPPCALTYQ